MNHLVLLNHIRRQVRQVPYDPIAGIGSTGPRVKVSTPVDGLPEAFVPLSMTEDPEYRAVRNNPTAWRRLRCFHDFEYWCATCASIKPKHSCGIVRCIPNGGQRAVIETFERQRRQGRRISVIILKARQWGCSTIVQLYMGWMQLCRHRQWNSVIAAHVKDTSAIVRGMYTRLLENYPADMWDDDKAPVLKAFQNSANIKEISGRDTTITLATSQRTDSIRGADMSMAHLTEVAFWRETERTDPKAMVQSIYGSLADAPDAMMVMESTANGDGNYFYSEWMRCRSEKADKECVFIPWHAIESNSIPDADVEHIAQTITDDERKLFDSGITLEQIAWYRRKQLENADIEYVKADFPSFDDEAFRTRSTAVFSRRAVENLRPGCLELAPLQGEINDAHKFVPDYTGNLQLWAKPRTKENYIVAVDVGGRNKNSDWSVITALKRPNPAVPDSIPEVVAQWRGHCDHDILVDHVMRIGNFYNRAFVVIESNTLESRCSEGGGQSNLFILNRLQDKYDNLYRRESFDSSSSRRTRKVGFHTNRATKDILINSLVAHVRDGSYFERDTMALDELLAYQHLENGSYAARKGCHDDILMTRALAMHIIDTEPVC